MTERKTVKNNNLLEPIPAPDTRINGSIFTRSDENLLSGIEMTEVDEKSDDQNDEGKGFVLRNFMNLFENIEAAEYVVVNNYFDEDENNAIKLWHN